MKVSFQSELASKQESESTKGQNLTPNVQPDCSVTWQATDEGYTSKKPTTILVKYPKGFPDLSPQARENGEG